MKKKLKIKKENRSWLDRLKINKAFLIAGPCSAETEEQVLSTAKSINNLKPNFFRAGIWKPRTRPGGFEGVGEIGLPWLQKIQKNFGLKVATEVGNANHVEKALNHNIDLLWIGARTTVNPFAVQEIAEALKGTDKIVLIKNPVNPDLGLWLGGIERIKSAGIKNIGAIHRGFSSYDALYYRNKPEWHITIELKKEFPNLPLIIDPSHICGRRDAIFETSQTGLDLNYDGLMIESHMKPIEAWSDSKQQITPLELADLIDKIVIPQATSHKKTFQLKLDVYRNELDILDSNLIELLNDRMSISELIGNMKRKENVAILQSDRWGEILPILINEAEKKGLNQEFIKEIFKRIHVESIKIQRKK